MDDSIPIDSAIPGQDRMLVYHFLNEQFGLEDIKFRRLKVSRIMELNDPFEFHGCDLSNPTHRWALENMKERIAKSRGILCFSASWSNPVLWAHYADKHQGLCLGFEVPDDPDPIFGKVDYRKERFPFPENLNDKFMKKVLFTKFEHWAYEREIRGYIGLEDSVDGIYYFNFSEKLKLKEVIIGERSSITRGAVSDALGELGSDVETFKVSKSFTKFKMVRRKWD